MAIIKYTTKSGITYCYESIPKWDPDKKQARPQKQYLGRWDEETQTIIPSTGKRGRMKKQENPEAEAAAEGRSGPAFQEYQDKIEKLRLELKEAREQIASLSQKNREYAAALEAVRRILQKI